MADREVATDVPEPVANAGFGPPSSDEDGPAVSEFDKYDPTAALT